MGWAHPGFMVMGSIDPTLITRNDKIRAEAEAKCEALITRRNVELTVSALRAVQLTDRKTEAGKIMATFVGVYGKREDASYALGRTEGFGIRTMRRMDTNLWCLVFEKMTCHPPVPLACRLFEAMTKDPDFHWQPSAEFHSMFQWAQPRETAAYSYAKQLDFRGLGGHEKPINWPDSELDKLKEDRDAMNIAYKAFFSFVMMDLEPHIALVEEEVCRENEKRALCGGLCSTRVQEPPLQCRCCEPAFACFCCFPCCITCHCGCCICDWGHTTVRHAIIGAT